MIKIAYTFLLLATLVTSAFADDPAPAAWTRETDPKPRADFVAQWRIEYANDFNGPWMPAPIGLEGRFSAGFMNEFVKELLREEMEEHVTGDTPQKYFRFVQTGA